MVAEGYLDENGNYTELGKELAKKLSEEDKTYEQVRQEAILYGDDSIFEYEVPDTVKMLPESDDQGNMVKEKRFNKDSADENTADEVKEESSLLSVVLKVFPYVAYFIVCIVAVLFFIKHSG